MAVTISAPIDPASYGLERVFPPCWALALAFTCLLALGWQRLIWKFLISAVMSHHGTRAINSCHVYGSVRYKTSDTSRNNVIFEVISLGEGWHNDHHDYSTSAKIGFWSEIDIAYYVLQVLAFFRIVWELKHIALPKSRLSSGKRASVARSVLTNSAGAACATGQSMSRSDARIDAPHGRGIEFVGRRNRS